MESEFRVISIQSKLHELTREELEEYLVECLRLLTSLTHQTSQLRDYLVQFTNEG